MGVTWKYVFKGGARDNQAISMKLKIIDMIDNCQIKWLSPRLIQNYIN